MLPIRLRKVVDNVAHPGEVSAADCRHQSRNTDLTLNLPFHVWPNAPDEERALACLLNPVDGPDGRTPAHLFKARAPHPGRWAADRRPIGKFTGSASDPVERLVVRPARA